MAPLLWSCIMSVPATLALNSKLFKFCLVPTPHALLKTLSSVKGPSWMWLTFWTFFSLREKKNPDQPIVQFLQIGVSCILFCFLLADGEKDNVGLIIFNIIISQFQCNNRTWLFTCIHFFPITCSHKINISQARANFVTYLKISWLLLATQTIVSHVNLFRFCTQYAFAFSLSLSMRQFFLEGLSTKQFPPLPPLLRFYKISIKMTLCLGFLILSSLTHFLRPLNFS